MRWIQDITPNTDDQTLQVWFGVIGAGKPLSDWYGDCLAVARNSLGIKDPIGASAWDCYKNYNKFNHSDRNWPIGVYFLIWFSGSGGDGHVAIAYIDPATGKMTIWTSPWHHKPYFDMYYDVDRLASGYHVTYAGWSEDMGGIRIIHWQADTPAQEGDDVAEKITVDTSRILSHGVLARNGLAGRPEALGGGDIGDSYIGKELTNALVQDLFLSDEGRQWRDSNDPNSINGINARLSAGDTAESELTELHSELDAQTKMTADLQTKLEAEQKKEPVTVTKVVQPELTTYTLGQLVQAIFKKIANK